MYYTNNCFTLLHYIFYFFIFGKRHQLHRFLVNISFSGVALCTYIISGLSVWWNVYKSATARKHRRYHTLYYYFKHELGDRIASSFSRFTLYSYTDIRLILYDMYNIIYLYTRMLEHNTDDAQTSAEQRLGAATERVYNNNNIHRFFSLFHKCARGGFPSLTRSKLNLSLSPSHTLSLSLCRSRFFFTQRIT